MSSTETDKYRHVLYLLGIISVEIRAVENLLKAQILAEVFHNVPAMLTRRFSLEEIMGEIDRKSVRHVCGRMISALFEMADKRPDGA